MENVDSKSLTFFFFFNLIFLYIIELIAFCSFMQNREVKIIKGLDQFVTTRTNIYYTLLGVNV